jgi:hypothetical protein
LSVAHEKFEYADRFRVIDLRQPPAVAANFVPQLACPAHRRWLTILIRLQPSHAVLLDEYRGTTLTDSRCGPAASETTQTGRHIRRSPPRRQLPQAHA